MEIDTNGGLETSWEKIKTLCDKGSRGDEENSRAQWGSDN